MSNTNPARGMRDFLPADVRKRNYVIGIIREVYEKYGFEPLETPTVENLSTLTNKYGEEGEQLMFKILKRGEKLEKQIQSGEIKNENELTDLALRYDLTVPLARVVANYKNDLPKFFKRYQIQPVWRADRPARGRYREFYQCDVDAIGSSSMIVEAELCSAVSEILERLDFDDFVIRVNHREILREILNVSGVDKSKHSDALVSIDKLDKIGNDGVLNELSEKGIDESVGEKIISAFSNPNKYVQEPLSVRGSSFQNFRLLEKLASFVGKKENQLYTKNPIGDWQDVVIEAYPNDVQNSKDYYEKIINWLIELTGDNENGTNAIEKMFELYQYSWKTKSGRYIEIDASLARGLSYYTGAIFEVVLTNGDFSGSIAGGGRYDGLIGMFGKEEIPAVGFSLGLERILLIMEERGEFERLEKEGKLETKIADVLITVWNKETAGESLKLANELRQKGLRVLVYPQADKLGKQFKYADQIGIKTAIILREEEIVENKVKIKNLQTGEEDVSMREDIAEQIQLI